jgi:hypothetical protein
VVSQAGKPRQGRKRSPQIAFVIVDPASTQKLQVFLPEGLLSMMFLLAEDYASMP